MTSTDQPDGRALLDIYRRAILIRKNDERVKAVMQSGRMVTTYYSPCGQEIVPAALSLLLTNEDYIVTIYRGMHDQLAKGLPLRLLWAEYAGRVTGTCKGKGGPMHITHPATGVMVTTGVVGSGIPIANGIALASQLRQDGRITVTNFGDGATNIGAFHEGLNLASVWRLPVVFVCQNNLYSEHTAFAKGTGVDQVVKRAESYGMPGIRVDGNDPVAMWLAAKQAVDRARDGGGPTLIEAMTFRFSGHQYGDDDSYIPAEMMAAALARDPVPALRATLVKQEYATEAELSEIEGVVDAAIDDAVEFALSAPYPDLAELGRDVYADEVIQ